MLPLRKRNVGSVDAVCELIKARAGISILSRWGIDREVQSGALIAFSAGQGGIPIAWHAVLGPNAGSKPQAEAVCKCLVEWFRDSP